jgi:DNA-binding NarL/FixJ family response regulator
LCPAASGTAGRGLSNGEIATELAVTVKAVEKHIGSVYAKLGSASRGRLIAYYIQDGLAQRAPAHQGPEDVT